MSAPPESQEVGVTRHALERWRQRGAPYADATASDVVAAFRESQAVPDGEELPMKRCDGCFYKRHQATGGYFIAVAGHGTRPGRVVSFIVPGLPDAPILAHKKRSKPAKEPPPKPQEEPAAAAADPRQVVATYQERKEEYAALAAEAQRSAKQTNRLRNLQAWMQRNRPAYKAAQVALSNERLRLEREARRRERESGDPGSLFRKDGSLDFEKALLELLRRTERFASE